MLAKKCLFLPVEIFELERPTLNTNKSSFLMKKIFTRFSTTLLLLSTCLLLVGSAWTQTTITQWNFNGESATTVPGGTTSPTTAVGTGTASLVGGTTATFASGVANGGSTDPVITAPPNYGWNVTTFAAQSMGNKERGVQFLVSTVGFQNIQVRWDQRHSNTSARHVRLQYTTDGSTWVDFGTLYEGTSGDTWFNGRSANLSTITAANNNANFGIRIVAEFAPSTTNYAPSQSTGTYGATSTWRFDMVTISGTAIPATTCSITGISASNISACDGKNTHNTGDDTFTADVTVTFTNPPSTGNLVLSGDGSASVAVGSLSTATSHTFVGVTMPADGGAIGLTATFSADTPCSFTNNNAGTAPAACSPTCNDGIQNGDETDVDCGGATCPPCGPVVDCPSLTGAPTVVDESCAGAADGSITINATSSSQPLEYALDEEGPFQSSNQFTGLSAGCYKITIQTQTCAVTTMVIVRNSSPTVSPQVKELAFSPVSQLNTGGTEIIAYDSASKRLFSTNGANMRVDIIDFSNPSSPNVIGAINMLSDPNSVAVKNGIVAIAVANGQNPGSVIFADINGNVLNTVTVGALPDMLVFTPDGQKVLVANEGEPNNSYTIDPEGSISIIDISGGVASATVATADFSAYIGQEAALRAQGIRIFGPGANAAQDFEPEFITISEDGTTAYVALQENNAIAIVDIASATVTDIKPLGYKDHSLPSNALDPSDRDVDGTTASGGKININTWKVLGMYQPDGMTSYTVGNETYLVTANEGDARDYTGFSEEIRVGSNNYPLDPTRFPNATQLKLNQNLGRLNVTNTLGDIDNDGDFDEIYVYGARSFSIWRASDMSLVYDSGDDFERITAAQVPAIFNSDGTAASFDTRSDNKGPEPEAVEITVINGKTYAFVALERTGGLMVYNVTNPNAPEFVTYIPAQAGDRAPEDIVIIEAADSPTGETLILVANEVSGTISTYSVRSAICEAEVGLCGNAQGGSGTYSTHQWQITGGTAQGAALKNTSSPDAILDLSSVTVGGTVEITYTVMDANGCSRTGTLTTSVLPRITSVVFNGETVLCSSAEVNLSVAITGGAGPFTIIYTDGEDNFTIENYNSNDNIPVMPTETTTYTLLSVKDQGMNGMMCEADLNQQAVTIGINTLTPGAIGGSQTVCLTKTPAPFQEVTAATVSNPDAALTYRWEGSTSGAPDDFVAVGTGINYNIPGPLSQPTFFRRVAVATLNGVACEAISNTIFVDVKNVNCGSFPWGGSN